LLAVVLVMMGQGLLARRVAQYRWAESTLLGYQALALAESGLEDARAKLGKDPLFPPPNSDEQVLFSYWEDLGEAGSYRVEIDRSYVGEPYQVLVVRATGYVGSPVEPLAVRTVRAELDVNPRHRSAVMTPNPDFYRFITWTVD